MVNQAQIIVQETSVVHRAVKCLIDFIHFCQRYDKEYPFPYRLFITQAHLSLILGSKVPTLEQICPLLTEICQNQQLPVIVNLWDDRLWICPQDIEIHDIRALIYFDPIGYNLGLMDAVIPLYGQASETFDSNELYHWEKKYAGLNVWLDEASDHPDHFTQLRIFWLLEHPTLVKVQLYQIHNFLRFSEDTWIWELFSRLHIPMVGGEETPYRIMMTNFQYWLKSNKCRNLLGKELVTAYRQEITRLPPMEYSIENA